MEKLSSLIGQVKKAADKLKGEIYALDVRIEEAFSQRARLTEGNVSKSDFMAYVAEDIRRRGEVFKRKLTASIKAGKKEFGTLDPLMSNPSGRMNYSYLSAEHYVPNVPEEAFYWYFPEIIVERMSDAISGLPWPDDAMPVAERREVIKKLDQEISELTAERDTLANDLIRAGLAG